MLFFGNYSANGISVTMRGERKCASASMPGFIQNVYINLTRDNVARNSM